jgi:hypothetical protein
MNMEPRQKLRVLYVHGMHRHPPEAEYRAAWDAALARMAYVPEVETRMLYWADIRLGVTPQQVAEAHARARSRGEHRFGRLRPQTNSPLGYAVSLALHLAGPVIRAITKELATEVYLYFYGRCGNADDTGAESPGRAATGAESPGRAGGDTDCGAAIRDVVLDRMDALLRDFAPDVVLAHSWGTVIAYDYLVNRGLAHELEALITLGCPLGQTYVQERVGAAAYPPRVRRWLNVFDAMDPVTWPDRRIANDLRGPRGERLVRDVEIASVYDEDGRRDPHSWWGYVMSEPVQAELFRIAASRALWGRAVDDGGLRRAG